MLLTIRNFAQPLNFNIGNRCLLIYFMLSMILAFEMSRDWWTGAVMLNTNTIIAIGSIHV